MILSCSSNRAIGTGAPAAVSIPILCRVNLHGQATCMFLMNATWRVGSQAMACIHTHMISTSTDAKAELQRACLTCHMPEPQAMMAMI